MTKQINQVEIRFPNNREKLIRESASQEETCVSVGGLAGRFGMTAMSQQPELAPMAIGPKAFAKLVEFWRREKQLSVADLASQTGLTETDILNAEAGDSLPEPRVLRALSTVLDVSYEKLLRLTGHVADRDESVETAAVRFTARSEPMERLNRHEEEALHEFVRALAE